MLQLGKFIDQREQIRIERLSKHDMHEEINVLLSALDKKIPKDDPLRIKRLYTLETLLVRFYLNPRLFRAVPGEGLVSWEEKDLYTPYS